MSGSRRPAASRGAEAGFTLVEALVAIVVLVFGLIAVTNLIIVAASANSTGNHSTAATAHASEVMERLKAVPFASLVPSSADSIETDRGSITNCDDATQNCVVGNNYNARRAVSGVGTIKTRWHISSVDGQTLFIRVRSASTATLMGRRSQAEFTTFRSCTAVTAGCPNP